MDIWKEARKKKKVRFTTYLDKEVLDALKELCEAHGVSVNIIIEGQIMKLLEKESNTHETETSERG